MRVLFDACVPRPLRNHLSEFEVKTAQEMGWGKLGNGTLLAAAENEFDVFLTVDRGIQYQQPTHRFAIGIVTVRVVKNQVRYFAPHLEDIRVAIQTVPKGHIVVVGA